MAARRQGSSRDAWIIAWALAVLLHALGLVGLRQVPVIGRASAARPAQLEPVQLVFSPPSPTSPRDEKPQVFTELPPDRKDAAPAKADFLSNVTSRARDQVPGGDAALPQMRGEVDAPMVELEPNGGSPHPPAPSPSPPLTTPSPSPPQPADAAAPTATFTTKGVGGPAATAQSNAGPTRPSPDD